MNKKVIILNGPSSSGKSTLACKLQEMIKEKQNVDYGITSIDDFLTMSINEVIYEDDVFNISSKLCDSAMNILTLGCGVIIDHVITSERIYHQVTSAFSLQDCCFIHVLCPLSELKKREKERHNRCLGSAEASFMYLFPKEGYDLAVDTYQFSIKECSLQIIEHLLCT